MCITLVVLFLHSWTHTMTERTRVFSITPHTQNNNPNRVVCISPYLYSITGGYEKSVILYMISLNLSKYCSLGSWHHVSYNLTCQVCCNPAGDKDKIKHHVAMQFNVKSYCWGFCFLYVLNLHMERRWLYMWVLPIMLCI